MSEVLREIDGAVGRITLNRADQMNAITVALATELEDAVVALGHNPDVNVVLIQGVGQNFCAGGDFNEVQQLRAAGPSALRTLFDAFKAACDAISQVPAPVVAAVRGVAMAGGFELMQAADITLVSDEARISDNHINFGMIPGGGSTARLPRIVGRQRALGILLSGDRMTGRDAVEFGLAYRSYPEEQFAESIQAFVDTLAGRDRSALTAIKHLVNDGLTQSLGAALAAETDAVVARIAGQAGHDGVTAFKARAART
ncbi:enoyl-CoA hydratase [Mycobacterium sp. CBMA 234]|uniref:enoyl-CoA hydratase/isomerase family protein n=1 Tax=Mycolicibacterium sp. CBMA 234 TaxID=1918495 RepID=UPI0012DC4A75|nr:enoyl-CoA hydratase/isomerase family protein [Mycolicibacterium sp. CBMA 234]MUL67891.1 enoyl-CoA hydratase [Mycolicibacterium sp. CBMA 234]